MTLVADVIEGLSRIPRKLSPYGDIVYERSDETLFLRTASGTERGMSFNGLTLIGEQDGQRVWADTLARKAGMIAYEILTSIDARIPRRFNP